MFINHSPFLIIISSPSGAGKSTICKMIVQNDPLIQLSISATTRAKRPNEIDGQHYFFVSQENFLAMKKQHEFLEDAEVFENFYGTPFSPVKDALNKGHCVLF
ncbi:MAG: guanylate kinase, partial [Alphaproteobacteria bacterium]